MESYINSIEYMKFCNKSTIYYKIEYIIFYLKKMNTVFTMDETLYNTMLFLDIENIKNLCLVNKRAYAICNNAAFWKDKFSHEGLFFLPSLIEEMGLSWIETYEEIKLMYKRSKEVLYINHIETSSGARTSLLLSSQKAFLLAVPARSANPAALWTYKINE